YFEILFGPPGFAPGRLRLTSLRLTPPTEDQSEPLDLPFVTHLLQRLHVFNQCLFFTGQQICSVQVPFITVARGVRFVTKTGLFRCRAARHKAHVFLVVYVIAAIEHSGTVRRNFQKVLEGWHGSIVEEWTSQPNSIQADREVAIRAAEVVK